jgi:hypothetical protein
MITLWARFWNGRHEPQLITAVTTKEQDLEFYREVEEVKKVRK